MSLLKIMKLSEKFGVELEGNKRVHALTAPLCPVNKTLPFVSGWVGNILNMSIVIFRLWKVKTAGELICRDEYDNVQIDYSVEPIELSTALIHKQTLTKTRYYYNADAFQTLAEGYYYYYFKDSEDNEFKSEIFRVK